MERSKFTGGNQFWLFKGRKKSYSGYIFRTHSYLNLLDLNWIADSVDGREVSELNIMPETILSTYMGHTIFSLFLDKCEVFE